jgi:hypothetical protein
MHDPSTAVERNSAEYTAKSLEESADIPPRIDKVTADFYIGYMKSYSHEKPVFGGGTETVHDSTVKRWDVKSGSAVSFVEVAPNKSKAKFTTRRIPTAGGACITADAIVAKVIGATSYDLTVTGIVESALGTSYHRVFTGVTRTGSIMDIYDTGSFYGVPMDGGCNTIAEFITKRQEMYQKQFKTAKFEVKTAP